MSITRTYRTSACMFPIVLHSGWHREPSQVCYKSPQRATQLGRSSSWQGSIPTNQISLELLSCRLRRRHQGEGRRQGTRDPSSCTRVPCLYQFKSGGKNPKLSLCPASCPLATITPTTTMLKSHTTQLKTQSTHYTKPPTAPPSSSHSFKPSMSALSYSPLGSHPQ